MDAEHKKMTLKMQVANGELSQVRNHRKQRLMGETASLHSCDIKLIGEEHGHRANMIKLSRILEKVKHRKRMNPKTDFPRIGVKIFISISLIVNLHNHFINSPSNSLVLRAEAGSKSSKASKTTVIAIDGGGGGSGPAHPVPVPWPVVHCHHHHHHLKYVPKPILVHHWIKKAKAQPTYEFTASSNRHPLELGVEEHGFTDQTSFQFPQSVPPVMNQDPSGSEFLSNPPMLLPKSEGFLNNGNSEIPNDLMEGSKMVSSLSNVFDDHNQDHSMSMSEQSSANKDSKSPIPAGMSPLSPPSLAAKQRMSPTSANLLNLDNEWQKRLQGLRNQAVGLNRTQFQLKKLDKLAQTLLSARLKKFPLKPGSLIGDADSVDSFVNIALANSTGALGNGFQFDAGHLDIPKSMNNINSLDSRANSSSSLVKQIDGPQKSISSKDQLMANIHRANQLEQNHVSRLYDQVAAEHSDRMQSLGTINRMVYLAAPQQIMQPFGSAQTFSISQSKQPAFPSQYTNLAHGLTPSLIPAIGAQVARLPQRLDLNGPKSVAQISARAASALSESNTIEVMTKLAEQMAQAEVRKLIDMQRKKQETRKTDTIDKTGAVLKNIPSKASIGGRGLFSMFHYPSLKHQRDRRRRDSPTMSNNKFMTFGANGPALFDGPIVSALKSLGGRSSDTTIRTFNMAPRPSLPQASINLETRGPSSGLMTRHTSTNFGGEQLSIQASNTANKISDPPEGAKDSESKKSTIAPVTSVPLLPEQKTSAHQLPSVSPMVTKVVPAKQVVSTTNAPTTMNSDQETKFYYSQRDHLLGLQQQQQRRQLMSQWGLNGLNSLKNYNSQSSNLHNFIVEAPAKLLSQTSVSQETNPGANSNWNSQVSPSNGTPLNQASEFQFAQSEPLYKNYHLSQQQLLSQISENQIAAQNQLRPSSSQIQLADESPITSMPEGQMYQHFAENMVPMASYLEFPLPPQIWSAEALKSINGEQSTNSTSSLSVSDDGSGDGSAEGSEGSKDTSLFTPQYDTSNLAGSQQQQETLFSQQPFETSQIPMGQGLTWQNMAMNTQQQQQQPLQSLQYFQVQSPFHFQSHAGGIQPQLFQMASDLSMNPYNQQTPIAASNMQSNLFAEPNNKPNPEDQASYSTSYPINNLQTNSIQGESSDSQYLPTDQTVGPNHHMLSSTGTQMNGMNLYSANEVQPTKPNGLAGASSNNRAVGLMAPPPLDSMGTASAEMNQLRQFHNSLSQGAGQANNFTAMTGFSRQIRDQMRTLQGRLPQMPQMPNIPQPPQLPNLPMPPPGMMQMAGLALPFAMARATRQANRVRDQRVNAAASGGGTSSGQRIFNRALNSMTNRLSRPRTKPSSAPSMTSSGSGPKNRNRFYGLVQTVVDMNRRPSQGLVIPSPGSSKSSGSSNRLFRIPSSALSKGPKLRAKVDENQVVMLSEGRAKRLGRAIGWPGLRQSSSLGSLDSSDPQEMHFAKASFGSTAFPGIALPTSVLATVTDGSLSRFASMTSPMDMMAQEFGRRKKLQHQRQLAHETTTGEAENMNGFTNEESSNVSSESNEINRSKIQQSHTLSHGIVPVPVVANHINLLLFTAQNVTGQLPPQQHEQESTGQGNEKMVEQYQPEEYHGQQQQQQQLPMQPTRAPEEASDEHSGNTIVAPEKLHQKQQATQQASDRPVESEDHAERLRESEQSTVQPEAQASRQVSRSSDSPKVKVEEQPQHHDQSVITANSKITLNQAKLTKELDSSSKEHRQKQDDYQIAEASFVDPVSRLRDTSIQQMTRNSASVHRTIKKSSPDATVPKYSLYPQLDSMTKPTSAPMGHTSKPPKMRDNEIIQLTGTVSSKSKRSTSRPNEFHHATALEAINSDARINPFRSDFNPMPVATTTVTASPLTTQTAVASTLSTLYTSSNDSLSPPQLPSSSSPVTPPVDDYVRAIKLVRGVAYPWPPPATKSLSNEGSAIDATTIASTISAF